MRTVSWQAVTGERFPSGRRTRLLIAPGSAVEAERFVMGHVTIEPGGGIPNHEHAQEEVYYILEGCATLTIDGEIAKLPAGTAVHLPPQSLHELNNQTQEPITILFVYAPTGIVDHWQEEREGHLVITNPPDAAK
ncbi:cupin domain-containing protein [Anaerosporomusa subterranea]|uniref:cupin domain-containing protein n=1 Tax=Anaerosporomusa subterranea TaxID=1794912 RepID=UPI000826269B|nr:dimethylsulfonioproprionate lyase family protein [Anaerosporomusa subterranea]